MNKLLVSRSMNCIMGEWNNIARTHADMIGIRMTHNIADLPDTDSGCKGHQQLDHKGLRASNAGLSLISQQREGWKIQLAHHKTVKWPSHAHQWTLSHFNATDNTQINDTLIDPVYCEENTVKNFRISVWLEMTAGTTSLRNMSDVFFFLWIADTKHAVGVFPFSPPTLRSFKSVYLVIKHHVSLHLWRKVSSFV